MKLHRTSAKSFIGVYLGLVRGLCILGQHLAAQKLGWNWMEVALSCRLCLLQCPAECGYTGLFLHTSLFALGRGGTEGSSGREGWTENCRWSLKKNFLSLSLILIANNWIFFPLVFPSPHLLLIMLIITPFATDFCQVGDCCVVSVSFF